MQKTKEMALPDEAIISKIYLIRGQKVMLDRDLAVLYGINTKTLKQAVKRNIDRFPDDFMFEMDAAEFKKRLSQKGSLFNLLEINTIMLITFHNTLMIRRLKCLSLFYEKLKDKIQTISAKSADGNPADL